MIYSAFSLRFFILEHITLLYFMHSSGLFQFIYKNSDKLNDTLLLILPFSVYLYLWSQEEH